MNPVLAELLATGQVKTPQGEARPLHSHLPRLEGELLQMWLVACAPVRLIEIGLAYGVSSLFIGDALPTQNGVQYHIIDPHQSAQWEDIGKTNLDRAGFAGCYILHQEPSELCLPRMLAQGLTFEFAFVDGFHTFDHALVDFFYLNRMLTVGGIIVFDDIFLPSLQKLCAYIRGYPCYREFPFPAEFLRRREVRVRRMMQAPLTRLCAFQKTAEDTRFWDWYHEF